MSNYYVSVPWISQYDKIRVIRAGDSACYRACLAMARAIQQRLPPSTIDRIQMATHETRTGAVVLKNSSEMEFSLAAKEALSKNEVFILGVSHASGRYYNRDNITDHFVLVYAKIKEVFFSGSELLEETYYLAHDPATRWRFKGEARKFYVRKNGLLYKHGEIARGEIVKRAQYGSMAVFSKELNQTLKA